VISIALFESVQLEFIDNKNTNNQQYYFLTLKKNPKELFLWGGEFLKS